jgi:hypothetical protein
MTCEILIGETPMARANSACVNRTGKNILHFERAIKAGIAKYKGTSKRQ